MSIQLTISKCLDNDRDAQRVLLEEYGPKIMFVCKRYANGYIEAEDLFQESAVRMFDKLNLHDPSKGDFGGWVYRLTVNVCIGQLSKMTKYEYDDIDEHNIPVVDTGSISGDLNRNEMLNLVNELPDSQKLIFNLHIIEGYKHEEIADMLDISASTSRSNLHRAKEKLKELFIEYNLVE